MDVTARPWSGYQWRVVIIAMMCLGFGGWSLYDALIGYPAQNVIADKWDHFPGDHLDRWWHEVARQEGWPLDPREMIERYNKLDERERINQWPDIAAAKGWPVDPAALIPIYEEGAQNFRYEKWEDVALKHGWPEDQAERPHHKKPLDIMTQFIMLAITAPIGLVFAYAFVGSFGRWIQCTDTQIVTSKGPRVPIDTIKRLNMRRWHKGIAVVHFDYGNGERRIVLDDWKFDRAAIGSIVAYLQEQLPPERIDDPRDVLRGGDGGGGGEGISGDGGGD